jgi:tetrahydromethanopterin S-methyltransferase subunit C
MTAAAAEPSRRRSLYARGMAVGLAGGLAGIAFAAVLPYPVAYIYVGAQLAGVGWIYFGFGVADGRPSASPSKRSPRPLS